MIDQVESALQNRLREIVSNRSDFSTDALNQVSQAVANSFVTVRQFCGDTRTRAQAFPKTAWTGIQSHEHDNMNGLCPDIFSPLQRRFSSSPESSVIRNARLILGRGRYDSIQI